jgi:hypothetical protein
MPIAVSQITRTIAIGQTVTPNINCIGHKLTAVYIPALGTSCTITIEASQDGLTYKNLKDTTPAIVGQWASSAGDFWLDGDSLARFLGIPHVRIKLGSVQAAAIDCIIIQSQD